MLSGAAEAGAYGKINASQIDLDMCDRGVTGASTEWYISADSGRGLNIQANPRVRVKVASWPRARRRAGTGHVLDDDDPRERQQIIGRGDRWRRLCVCTSRAMDTSPVTVPIDLDPADCRSGRRPSMG